MTEYTEYEEMVEGIAKTLQFYAARLYKYWPTLTQEEIRLIVLP